MGKSREQATFFASLRRALGDGIGSMSLATCRVTSKVPGIEQIDLAEPYRDYVVRAFNSDKPYDRFIAEQLAGDLLGEENETDEARLDRLAAPGFLSIGPWFEECTDPNKLRLDIIDEQISTSTRAFLALDFSCARCHDHKFDPIPTKDYYALAGIFRSTEITSDFATDWKDGRPRAITHIATDKEKQAAAQYEAKKQELLVELHQLRNRLLPQARLPQAPPETKTPQHIVSFEAEDFSGHKNLRILEQKTETCHRFPEKARSVGQVSSRSTGE